MKVRHFFLHNLIGPSDQEVLATDYTVFGENLQKTYSAVSKVLTWQHLRKSNDDVFKYSTLVLVLCPILGSRSI